MFTNTQVEPTQPKKTPKTQNSPNMYSYNNHNQHTNIYSSTEISLNNLDKILDKERIHNKTESWNKLDKTVKLHKLYSFSEKYGKEHNLSAHNVKTLKIFFKECLEGNKLQKTKDLLYDKNTQEITGIQALHFNPITHNFTLKIVDTKRVSTMKCLSLPRRTITDTKTTHSIVIDTNIEVEIEGKGEA